MIVLPDTPATQVFLDLLYAIACEQDQSISAASDVIAPAAA